MKWIEYIANILFWVITASLIASSFSIQGQEIEIINDIETVKTIRSQGLIYQLLVCVGVASLLFYTNFLNIISLKNGKLKSSVLLTSTALFFGTSFLLVLINKRFFFGQLLPTQISISILLFYFTISSSYGLVKVWILSEQKQKTLALEAKQAELNLLRNQLQPHFLFNALNNLLSLVNQEKSPKLASSFDGLSQLLRYVIEETKSDKVKISKEIAFINNYCDLQLLRFEENEVNLSIDVFGSYNNQLIEPGLFIPFVENAFKYGTAPELISNIKVIFDISNKNIIYFSVVNKLLPNLRKNKSTGTGINAIQKRLKIVYPKKHSLLLKEDENFTIELKIET